MCQSGVNLKGGGLGENGRERAIIFIYDPKDPHPLNSVGLLDMG